MLDVNHLLETGTYLAVALILFAETGLLVGFFLPGDTLLIAAGVFAAQGKLSLAILLPVAALASIAGYQVGYRIGHVAGPRIFKRTGGVLFRKDYLRRTQELMEKHGVKALLVARFIVVVRTIVPLMAGMGKMNRRRFALFNIIGSVLWTFSIILTAKWLATKIPNLDRYIGLFVLLAMVITSGSVFAGLMRSRDKRRELKNALVDEYHYFFKRG